MNQIEPANHSVLVVDDHEPTRYAIARALRAAGFKTVEASAGAQALELAEYVSAVVLDVHLPDLHGLEVCRLLRATPSTASLPIVQISAVYLEPEHKTAAERAGADAYMTAPVDFDVLTATLHKLLLARNGGVQ
jgi:CheY-like chemotaxis protein